jgi:hypothetical protein
VQEGAALDGAVIGQGEQVQAQQGASA